MDILRKVPHWQRFLTVDELDRYVKGLARRYKHARLESIGKSREGHPLLSLTVGTGAFHALMFGFPHSNEPIGSLTALTWAKFLCDGHDDLGYTWHIIPCIDPDGARLNQGWFTHVFNKKRFFLNYYRSAPSIQVDWAFPARYKKFKWTRTVPESRALMREIDKLKPHFIYPLHNAGIAGAYYYLSHNPGRKALKSLTSLMERLKIPMHKGSPELPYLTEFAPAVYKNFGPGEEYEYCVKNGKDPLKVLNQGADSVAYAKRHKKDIHAIITELPYLTDPRVNDTRPSKLSLREVWFESTNDARIIHHEIQQIWEELHPFFDKSSPFYKVVKEYLPYEASCISQAIEQTNEDSAKKKASIAEMVEGTQLIYFFNSYIIGQFIRLLDASRQTPSVKNARAELAALLDWRLSKLHDTKVKPIPIRKLVQAQLGALLIMEKDHLR